MLAETFKYLYMIFAEPSELPFHPDNYVLTTEAHFLPLTIGEMGNVVDEDRVIKLHFSLTLILNLPVTTKNVD